MTQTHTKFVLGGLSANYKPWVLTLEPVTQSGAERAISWQRIGHGQFDPVDYWGIADWDSTAKAFKIGERLIPFDEVGRAPYTEAAWAEFAKRLQAV